MEIHDVSVEDLFSDIQKEFELVVSSTGLNFKLQCKPNLPHVPMDRSKIKRVIANLLTNAIHHTPESGTVTLSCEEDAENNTVIISIRDNGLGISKSAINLLFIKFEQLKAKRVRGTSTGLGLPFAKKIVESHGGELFVESKLGEGSVFSFSLPLSSAVN